MAVGKQQLGSVLLEQQRYAEALEAYKQARDTFSRLNEPGDVAESWHGLGMVHQAAGLAEEAEEAYCHSLAIKVQLGNQAGQANTLGQLGVLYDVTLQKPEQAVAFYQRAAEIYCNVGDIFREGRQWSNMGNALCKLQRLEKARQAILRAIDCFAPFGHTGMPWKSWAILADIESAAGNSAAATDARHQALAAFLAYRRDGGENENGTSQLALAVRQGFASGDPGEAASMLQQLAVNPQAAFLLPFLTALQAITAGNRDRSLAEDPALHYSQAAEVLLLIEALQGPEAGAGG